MSDSDAHTDTESVENADDGDALPAEFTDEQLDALADAVKDRIIDDTAKEVGVDSDDSDLTFTEATEQVIEALDVVNQRFDVMGDRVDRLEDQIPDTDGGTDTVGDTDADADTDGDSAADSTDTQPTSDQLRGFQ